MAGHNKWSKIKHRKAVVDARRGKVWTKVAKAIIVASRNGGPDPASNLALRYAIDEARYANMPRDTIERAIKKGSGAGDTAHYESIRYEGYAPGGVAVIVEALTDNRTRTFTNVRECFDRIGGNVGSTGCVAYLFHPRGEIIVTGARDGATLSEDAVLDAGLEAGATDVQEIGDASEPAWLIVTGPAQLHAVRDALERSFTIDEARLTMVPESRIGLAGEHAEKVASLVEALEDLDDVQKVYTNADG